MELIILIAGGRSGSGLFHSLFDRHSQVFQLPAEFYYDDFWKKIKEIKNCDLIVKKFISDQKSLYNHNNKIDQNIEITNFSKYLPLKMEILIWIELIKRLSIRNLLYIPKFWWKRINCMKKKKFNKKKY